MPARVSVARIVVLGAVLAAGSSQPVAARPSPTPDAQARVTSMLRDLPLAFEPSQGHAGPGARFTAQGSGYALRLEPAAATLSLAKPGESRAAAIRMTVKGASPAARASGDAALPGRSNYLVGNDPAAWRVGIPRYAAVRYAGVYRGVDVVYHGAHQRQLEYDFVVAPGTAPGVIRLGFEGIDRLRLDEGGNLVVHTAGGDVTWRAPVAYQDAPGGRQAVAARYELRGKTEVGFRVGRYDRTKTLVLDPVLAYATYFRGDDLDLASAIAVDAAGNAYVTGRTCSDDFPTLGAMQGTLAGGCDAFVTKLSSTGAPVYSTYLGGTQGDEGHGIAVDGTGSASVAGQTQSADFPIVNAVQGNRRGLVDAFVARLSPNGDSLTYSTYLGGSAGESGTAVAVDATGSAYVTGFTHSTDFPTVNPLQATRVGGVDAFVTRLLPSGAVVYSTYLTVTGSFGDSAGYGIAVDGSGAAYVGGSTVEEDDLAGTKTASLCGNFDAFVAKLSPSGTAIVYTACLGGTAEDDGNAVAVDGAGQAYLAGLTWSADFPTHNALQSSLAGVSDAFLVKLAADGSVLYSTYLGGSDIDGALGVAADAAGNAYVTGATYSEDFPTVDPIQGEKGSAADAFLAKVSADGAALVYSTYFGSTDPADDHLTETAFGVAVDGTGNAHAVGWAILQQGPDEPTARPAHGFAKTPPSGTSDAFVFKVVAAPQNQPPECTAAAAAPSVLWSPDHTLVPITITGVTDPDGDPLVLTVSAITQDEPVIDNGTGTGHTCPDATGVGTGAPMVRAERAGTRSVPGDGRVYHVAFTATDPAGASCQGVATVCVPHDNAAGTCVDEGALYDSTACGGGADAATK